jgi:hypothetical protein
MAGFFNNSFKTRLAQKEGYRSNFEKSIALQISGSLGVNPKDLYEKKVIKYIKPETSRTYLADFELPNNIIIEAKGRWTLEERKKMMDIISCNPHLDIRIIFQDPHVRISKGAKTTYAEWCNKHNIKWAAYSIPKQWFEEKK